VNIAGQKRFAGWDVGHMSMGGTNNDFSNCHLVNPCRPAQGLEDAARRGTSLQGATARPRHRPKPEQRPDSITSDFSGGRRLADPYVD
jgi:hypothetical protein